LDKERDRVKKKMRFKDFILESIIDIPRKTFAPAVFDDADTKDPKIKPSVKKLIDEQIKEFEKEYPVLKVSLIGSILTKRYRNDADLDLNVLFDVPKEKQEEERVRLSQQYLSAKNPNNIQGKLIPGSKHPINFYFITDQKTYDDQNKKADAVFDIETNKFIKRPDDFVFDPGLYVREFERKVQELDVVKGELKRDIIDYNELKELTPNDVLDLQEKIKDKLEEIEDSLEDIVKIGDGVDAERRAAFDKDMSPDEIRQYGVKNRLPKNVIYKMLEKYHYLKFYKKCKKILEDGIVTDKEVKDLEMHEAREKSMVFTFGRFNPPTIGHQKLIQKVLSMPANQKKIYLSRSQDSKKNPLEPNAKLRFMRDMFKFARPNLELNPTNMVLDLMTSIYKKGFTDVTMVVGSDRVREFENILTKYNQVKSRHGYYDFDTIKVVSAGERDPDAEGAVGMSASKMRDAAAKGDKESFKKGLPATYRNPADVDRLFSSVRVGMGLKAKLAASYGGMMHSAPEKPVVSMEEFEQNQIRDLYVREMIFNVGDKVDYVKEDIQGQVKRRGTNYVVLEDNNNNLHKAWIWDCIPIAADREVEVREYNLDVDYGFKAVSNIEEDLDKTPQDKTVAKKPGTQPKKYYKDLSKGEKEKRADFFKRQKYKKSDDEDDYKPAPGDKDAKTKPSKHTLKYKKMFGELRKDLQDACWKGYKQVGMKDKNGKKVPNCVPESYDIGHDYAKHAVSLTPGQDGYDPNYQGGSYTPSDSKENNKQVINRPETTDISIKKNTIDVEKKDIEEWAVSDSTIDKYKVRYKEEWRSKLDEVVKRMMEKIDVKI
jgi:predicted nucleotidyltransferase